MKKYKVTYSDNRVYYAYVEANNQDEAEAKASDLAYSNPEELEQAWDNNGGLVQESIEEIK